MTDQATFRIRERSGVPVVEVTGELDISNVDDLRSFLRELDVENTAAVIFDLEHISYLDSHGLQVLVELNQRLHTTRRQLLVVASRETPPGKLVRAANLHLALKLFESIDEALLSLPSR